jgi:hypothetical protein
MRVRFRPHLTYANVMSTIAVFAVLAGGGAYAASKLKKNSVTTSKIRNGAVTGPKVAANTLTGANINASTLGLVPHAANSDQLGGAPASAFQSRVSGTCPSGNAISSVAQNGTVGCQSANVAQMMGASLSTVSDAGGLLAPVGLSGVTFTSDDIAMSASSLPSTAGNLFVRVSVAPGGGPFQEWEFKLVVNNSVTSVGCNISETATTCSNVTDTAGIPAGAPVWLTVIHAGGGIFPATHVTFGWTASS